MKCVYNACDGSGLIPSKVLGKFSDKPIPNCFTRCECHQDETEHYGPIIPGDYDFPCSDTFRGFTYQYCGMPDPASTIDEKRQDEAEGQDKPPQIVEHIVRQSNLSKQEWDLFQQTVRKVQFLENKLNEMPKRKKPESKYGYKGIR